MKKDKLRLAIGLLGIVLFTVFLSVFLIKPDVGSLMIDPEANRATFHGTLELNNGTFFPTEVKLSLTSVDLIQDQFYSQEYISPNPTGFCAQTVFVNMFSPTLLIEKTGLLSVVEMKTEEDKPICLDLPAPVNQSYVSFPINITSKITIDANNSKYYWFPFDSIELKLYASIQGCFEKDAKCLLGNNFPSALNLRENNNFWRGKVESTGFKGFLDSTPGTGKPYGDMNLPGVKTTSYLIILQRPIALKLYTILTCLFLLVIPFVLISIDDISFLVGVAITIVIGGSIWGLRSFLIPEAPPQLLVIDVFLFIMSAVIVFLIFYKLFSVRKDIKPRRRKAT